MMKSLRYLSLLAMLLHPMNSALAFSTSAATPRLPTSRTIASRSPHQASATQLNALGLSSLDTFFQTDPYLAGFLTCSIKASAADMVAQMTGNKNDQDNKETPFNLPRNLAFILYGGLYQGCVQTFIFTCLFPMWFPEQTTQTVLSQVAIDLLVLGPMFCMPTVYTMKALLANSDDDSDEEFRWTKGIETYVEHIQTKGILTKYWSIWGPVQTLNFGVVPPHLRVVFVAVVSFFWICLLSTTVNSSSEEQSAEDSSAHHHPPAFAFALPSFVQQQHQPVPIPVLVDSFVERQQYERKHAPSHP